MVLFDTAAICRYIDYVFDGPRLVPEDPLEAARMEQWVSALFDYVSRSIMGRCVVQYVLPCITGGRVDRAVIDAALPDISSHLAILDRALARGPFFHGDRPYIDDFILVPMIDALMAVAPEGPALVGEAPNVLRHLTAFQARPSYGRTVPQLFQLAA